MAGANDTPRLHLALLLLMTLAGVALRWTGIEYSLPHVSNNDEIVHYSQYRALVERDEAPETRRRFVAYPSAWVRAAVHVPRPEPPAASTPLQTELDRASSDFAFLRRCVAVLGSLVVPATWLLARRFVGSGWGLVAAAIAGTSVLGFCLSTQARPHGAVLPAITLAVAAAVEVVRRGTRASSMVAGLAAGAALAALQNGAAALLALVAAHALRLRTDGRRALVGLALASSIVLPIFFYAYPAALAKLLAKPFAGSTRHGFLASHGVELHDFQGGGTIAVVRAFLYHDPLLFAAAVAALVAGGVLVLRRRHPLPTVRAELWVVLAFCVPYLGALCLFERTYYRFALPLVPFAALFAVFGLRALGQAGAALAGGLILFQLACVVQVTRLHVAGDTAEQAAAWIQEHLERGSSRIAISPWVDLPLVRTHEALAAHGLATHEEVAPWLDHQRAMDPEALDALGWSIVDLPLRRAAQREALSADPAAFVRALEADYLVLDVFPDRERPIMATVRDGARATGRLLARFTPRGPDAADTRQIDPYVGSEVFAQDRFVLQIWGASALGTGLEIYRIER